MSDCRRSRTGERNLVGEEGNTSRRMEENGGAETEPCESDEALNANRSTPTACEKAPLAKAGEAMNEILTMNKGMPLACGNVPMTEVGGNIAEAVVNAVEVRREEVENEVSNVARKEDVKDSSSEEEKSSLVSYRTCAENLKNKAGDDSDLIKVIEEAKQEVDNFYQRAFKELGKEIYDENTDELVKKANEIFVLKLVREGKEIGSRLKKELGWIDRDSSATKKNGGCESEGSSNASSKKKGRVIKNSMDWVGIVKEFMGKDKEFERRVNEALKAVNDYLWTVFDKEKKAYLEEGKGKAERGAAIFLEIVKQSPAWGAENDLLGRILRPNQELIGGRICIWAEELDL